MRSLNLDNGDLTWLFFLFIEKSIESMNQTMFLFCLVRLAILFQFQLGLFGIKVRTLNSDLFIHMETIEF